MTNREMQRGWVCRWRKTIDSRSSLLCLLALYVGLHGGIAALARQVSGRDFLQTLSYLDASWYQHLATHGYDTALAQGAGAQYAFLPLWPMILWCGSLLINTPYLPFFGSVVSLVLLMTVVIWSWNHAGRGPMSDRTPNILCERTLLGVAFMLFSLGAWVFFSNHTEALFLFLSFFAFYWASQKEFRRATVFAGLATLTRNQGILVAITVGLFALGDHDLPWGKRVRSFISIGVGAAAFYACWLLFVWLRTGDIMASSHAQKQWHIVASWDEYVSNALWLSPNNAARAALFWSIIGTGLWLVTAGRRKVAHALPVGFYLLASALLWPLQGNNFPQAYRFGAVLYPFWYLCGYRIDQSLSRLLPRWQRPAKLAVLALLIAVTATVSRAFYFHDAARWPY